ncbi:hypothetical protein GH714_029480 [Hevea brasiliensis]|uniref:J domain-containing protein n=1 Tax=Hevea brasiliensis TaxID=3981 RepID=A0A6A6K7E4_HEVBR|nr:hypothetical protein GH714_029480 [Hevea brasiliensis]
MDDFPGLLAQDFGFKPQGKSAPMASSRNSNTNTFSSVNFGLGSAAPASHYRSSSATLDSAPIFDDHGHDRGSGGSDGLLFNDVFGARLSKKENESRRETPKMEKDSAAFDDLLPGFGRSSSPSISRLTSESSRSQKPSANSARKASIMMDDPFVVLESTSTPAASSSRLYVDPLEEISKFSSSGNTKVDNSSVNRGVFDDVDSFDSLGKPVPPVSPVVNMRGKDRSPLRTGPSMGGTYSPASEDPVDEYPVDEAEGHSQKKMSNDDFHESHETLFDVPRVGQNVSSPSYVNGSSNGVNSPPRYEDISESPDDVWLTVSEVPLFTQPTNAPPPSRPPPPRPPRISKVETEPQVSSCTRSSVASQIDELEDFAMGSTRSNVSEHADVLYGEDVDANASSAAASAAAMKEAMDKAEAKFRQMREREYLKAARSRETSQVDKDMQEAQQRELKERQERQQREREEEEREQRRLEERENKGDLRKRGKERRKKESRGGLRERETEQGRLREREKGRQAVERATREARERAAAEARLKAERAAVEKAAAEARERAERAAVQRAQAEARERAAAEARERAEKAAAEARERANAEARERAAVARAEADARQRAERAAVERAAAEARERAAADARERAAAASRANQQKTDAQQRNDNDLESFFSSKQAVLQGLGLLRLASIDPFFDTQNRGGSEAARRTPVGVTSSMKKASSTANIEDDLSLIFGATGTSGEFQQFEGETEERRRARLERHQRTQERAAKALAEKNQRDLQAQREQAERHRIAETLDVEIKRWAAGKEGNLRALLSTLQYVLWPECGWQPVSLTDLITAAAVKKVYRKATLCIHPDKVQQKGANLQQKYIAEKVFDLLKLVLRCITDKAPIGDFSFGTAEMPEG